MAGKINVSISTPRELSSPKRGRKSPRSPRSPRELVAEMDRMEGTSEEVSSSEGSSDEGEDREDDVLQTSQRTRRYSLSVKVFWFLYHHWIFRKHPRVGVTKVHCSQWAQDYVPSC